MGRDTPYPGVPIVVAAELRRIEVQCDGRHERQNDALAQVRQNCEKNSSTIVALVGKDGTPGALSAITDRLDKVEEEQSSQRKLLLKIALLVAGAGAGGAAVSNIAMRLL